MPCAKSVPHLNELHAKFEAKGLSIIGVTSESAAETVPWVEGKGAKYPYAYDKGDKLKWPWSKPDKPDATPQGKPDDTDG